MLITTKIQNAKIDYAEKYIDEPELLFINTQAYGELLSQPNTKEGIDQLLGNIKIIIADGMFEEFIFLTKEDVGKAEQSDEMKDNLILIKKREKSGGKIVYDKWEENAPAIISYKYFFIPRDVVHAYKRYLTSKN